MEETHDIDPREAQETVLYHCGVRMYVTTSFMDGCYRIRHWKCSRCGRTGKSVDLVPLGRAGARAQEGRRR